MTGPEFKAACLMIWGDGRWAIEGGDYLEINPRNMLKFAAGEKQVGRGFEDRLLGLLQARVYSKGAPPSAFVSVIRKALDTERETAIL